MAVYTLVNSNYDAGLRTFLGSPQFSPTNIWVGHRSVTVDIEGGCGFVYALPIAQGSVIGSATLTVTAGISLALTAVNSVISAHDADDATIFSNEASYTTPYATRTAARVNWDNIPAMTADVEYTSPEFKTVVQEVTDRPGWVSGNKIMIFWEDHDGRSTTVANTYRRVYDYFESAAKSARLNVTFTAPGGAPQMIIINMI